MFTPQAGLAHLGPEYEAAVVPGVPAFDWEPADLQPETSASADSWPRELAAAPLMKVRADSVAAACPGALHGVGSGVRSVLQESRVFSLIAVAGLQASLFVSEHVICSVMCFDILDFERVTIVDVVCVLFCLFPK